MIDLRKCLIERRKVELDPELAAHFLTFNTWGTQRPVREGHVQHLANKMNNGLFRYGNVAFAVRDDGKSFMINGQHVCNATIVSKETYPCELEKYKLNTDMDIAEAFRQFEILPRSLQDHIRDESMALKLTWPLRISSIIVSAAIMEAGGQKMLGCSGPSSKGTKKYMNKEDKVKLLGSHLKEGAFVADILTINGTKVGSDIAKHLKRAAVIYVMMGTWRKNVMDAGVFWTRVRDGENLRKTMAEMKLREFLLKTNMAVRGSAFASRKVTPHEYAYRCALAWNSFRTNKNTNLAYHAGNNIPILK